MKKTSTLALIVAATAILAGCSSTSVRPTHGCALNDQAIGQCASMEEAYKASRTMVSGSKAQSVFEQSAQAGPQANNTPVVGGQLSNYPDAGNGGAPVFQQPKVMRVWVAPYVDADGNLRSGEYAYFSTPGSWNYGTLKQPGAGSGILSPNRPENLGFEADIQARTQGRARPATTAAPSAPAAQGTPSAPPPSAQAAANNAYAANAPAAPAAATATDSSGTITQPYQRIGN